MAKALGYICKQIKSNGFARTFTTTAIKRDAGQQFTTVSIDEKTGIATLTLNRPAGNALSASFMGEIERVVKDLEQTKCHGLILTSALSRIFSGGVDLNEFQTTDKARLERVWCAVHKLWQTLFSTPLITAALVNGHAVAGGAMLALTAEYRIMLPNYKIGLNESIVGIVVPEWLLETYTNVMPNRRVAELDLTTGRIYSSEEAYKAGMIDELATSKEEAFEKCVAFINRFDKRTLAARAMTKRQFRGQILKNFEANRQYDVELFYNTMQKPEMQAHVAAYLKSVQDKNKVKK